MYVDIKTSNINLITYVYVLINGLKSAASGYNGRRKGGGHKMKYNVFQ